MTSDLRPTIEDIRQAAERIQTHAHRTPVMTSTALNHMVGGEVLFKCENLQKVGAFKFRGALNAVLSLTDEEAANGVGTYSSGNHAQAVSLAARIRGIPAHVVMLTEAPQSKKDAVADYGGRLTLAGPTHREMERVLEEILEATGAAPIPPFDHPKVIAGQGTAAMELLEQAGELDVIMAPVGGGGLISGTALVTKALSPGTKVIGAEPAEADDAYRSFKAGEIIPSHNPTTICDGLLSSLGQITFPIIRDTLDDIVTVSEAAIIEAMRLTWERMKIIIEPSSAVPLGALLEKSLPAEGRRIGVILSGGNMDLNHLPWQK